MTAELTKSQALLILNGLPNVGPVSLNRLLEGYDGDPCAVLSASGKDLQRIPRIGPATAETIIHWPQHFNLAREEEKLDQSGAAFVNCFSDDYPPLLREIDDPPIGLYTLGRYRVGRQAVAIVGSRRCTLYGQSVARRLAAELARLGFCIVSGLARGIDTAAHEGALSVGGKTVAVVGCGLDIIYPPENLDLYRKIADTGAVLSEFPFGRRADRQTFPMRNRVVAGICEGVIVVESDVNGGAMITARFAGEQGRSIFAVPGRIDQASSRGCHALIRDGAVLVSGVENVLEDLNYLGPLTAQAGGTDDREQPAVDLSAEETAILQMLRQGDILHPDTLADRTKQSAASVSSTLMMLELKRLVKKRSDGRFEAA